MRTFEVEVKYHHAGTEFKLGEFEPYTAAYHDGQFTFVVSGEAERKACIKACEYIAETLRREG